MLYENIFLYQISNLQNQKFCGIKGAILYFKKYRNRYLQNIGLEFWVIMGLLKGAVVVQNIMAQRLISVTNLMHDSFIL